MFSGWFFFLTFLFCLSIYKMVDSEYSTNDYMSCRKSEKLRNNKISSWSSLNTHTKRKKYVNIELENYLL